MKKSTSAECADSEKCLEILKLMVDGEASKEQEEYFNRHIEDCLSCLGRYDVEREIKQMVKTRAKRKEVPAGLIDSIRTSVFRISS